MTFKNIYVSVSTYLYLYMHMETRSHYWCLHIWRFSHLIWKSETHCFRQTEFRWALSISLSPFSQRWGYMCMTSYQDFNTVSENLIYIFMLIEQALYQLSHFPASWFCFFIKYIIIRHFLTLPLAQFHYL